MATEEAMGKGAHAGNLIKGIAAKVGGGGGGRPVYFMLTAVQEQSLLLSKHL